MFTCITLHNFVIITYLSMFMLRVKLYQGIIVIARCRYTDRVSNTTAEAEALSPGVGSGAPEHSCALHQCIRLRGRLSLRKEKKPYPRVVTY
jgi:hypothetical protein